MHYCKGVPSFPGVNFDGVNIIIITVKIKQNLPNLSYGIAVGSHHTQKDSKIFIPLLGLERINYSKIFYLNFREHIIC